MNDVKNNLICDSCGEDDGTVKKRINPYVKEIFGKETIICVCDECYHQKLMDI